VRFFALFSLLYAIARRSGFLDTGIGRALFTWAYFQYKKHLEDSFDGLIRRHPALFQGGHILDVGANIGYCSALFSRVAEPGRKVFAFEPEPFNMALLERVIRTRARGTVVPVPAAVGDREGEIRLDLNPRHHGDHRVAAGPRQPEGDSIVVPLVTVDGFLERHNAQAPVCLIKVDVQGYELAVCEGSRRTLERNPGCRIVLEYMPEAMEALGFSPGDLPAWFEKRGYHCYTVHKNGGLTPGLPQDLGARGCADLLFSRTPIRKNGNPG
jgi:FkbM family methyltransferase